MGSFRMRAKRQTAKTRESYDLHSAQQMFSPLGGVAKMLMESVLAAKNKTKAAPWHETVNKLRENGAKKKQMRRELEEDSEESLDQVAFRGLRKHILKEKNGDVDVGFWFCSF
jgi:hypothetical protein